MAFRKLPVCGKSHKQRVKIKGEKIKMEEKVLEKIDTEYEFFFLDMVKTTKENLFAKSGEIESKKAIVKYLNSEVQNNKEICLERMITSNGLIDEFYRYVTDHSQIPFTKALESYMKNYMA